MWAVAALRSVVGRGGGSVGPSNLVLVNPMYTIPETVHVCTTLEREVAAEKVRSGIDCRRPEVPEPASRGFPIVSTTLRDHFLVMEIQPRRGGRSESFCIVSCHQEIPEGYLA
jgi:hypothetical protein